MHANPWRKAPAALIDRFHEAAAGIEGLEVRKMFGFPAAFIGGNMTAGVHQESIMVRLPEAERRERLADGWSLFEPMPGRPMREYVALPPDILGDVDSIHRWIVIAADHVRTLPPKVGKRKR